MKSKFSKSKAAICILCNLVSCLGQDPKPFGKNVKQYSLSFYLNLRDI